jgi:hypothetical protein
MGVFLTINQSQGLVKNHVLQFLFEIQYFDSRMGIIFEQRFL